ncbi:hypothetical protein DFH28DRAFT_933308 [Melampsora americana]|nr:hypothetical protein DFH28DRAFT_933308 [Melampsora americana]
MDNTAKGTKHNTIINHTPPASHVSFSPPPPWDDLIYPNQAAQKAYVDSYAAAHGFTITTLDTQTTCVFYKCHLGLHRHSKAKKENKSKPKQSTNQSTSSNVKESNKQTTSSNVKTYPFKLISHDLQKFDWVYLEIVNATHDHATNKTALTTQPVILPTQTQDSISQTKVPSPTQLQCQEVAAPQSGVAGKSNEELDEASFKASNQTNIDNLVADEQPSDQVYPLACQFPSEPPLSNLPTFDLNTKSIPFIKSLQIKGNNNGKEVQPQIRVNSTPAPAPVLPPQEALAPSKEGCKGTGQGKVSKLSEVQLPATVHHNEQLPAPKEGTKQKLSKGWADIDKVHKNFDKANIEQPNKASDPAISQDQKDHKHTTQSRKQKENPNSTLQLRLSTCLKAVVTQISADTHITATPNPGQPAASNNLLLIAANITQEIEEPIPSTLTGNNPVGPAMTKHQKHCLAKKESLHSQTRSKST